MTNIIVRKNKPDDVTTDPGADVRQREGMAHAGDKINTWMEDTDVADPLVEEFFDDLFDEIDGNTENNYGFFVELKDAMGANKLNRVKLKKGRYRFNHENKRYLLKVKCEEDQTESNRKVNMRIAIPEKRGNLLGGGYITKILNDLKVFIAAGEDVKAKQYLLAIIFLNRCQ